MVFLRQFLLSLYLLGSFFSATHLHPHDLFHTHSDCKVCVVAKNLNGELKKEHSFNLDTPPFLAYSDTLYLHIITAIQKGFLSTAPPL